MSPEYKQFFRPVLAIGLALGLSACASTGNVRTETATRDAPLAASITAPEPEAPVLERNYDVVAINVAVPEKLRVSEANRYYPGGDIVWREDPIGDRHQQVRAIVKNALQIGADRIEGDRRVVLNVEVTRFHALSEKARYTIGGVHAIQFKMEIRDAETNEIIEPPRFIKADFDALGGHAAVNAERRGVTQKVRITQHLARVIQLELTQDKRFVAEDTGLMGAINQL